MVIKAKYKFNRTQQITKKNLNRIKIYQEVFHTCICININLGDVVIKSFSFKLSIIYKITTTFHSRSNFLNEFQTQMPI